jgi:hypothetical protein
MWPDWLNGVIPRDPREEQGHTQSLTKINLSSPSGAVIQPELQHHRGPPRARKIRKICATCNSGWMSRLESAAKPTLSALILRKTQCLSQIDQQSLAAWTVMISIVAEYTDIPTQSIPDEQRQYLKDNGVPPDGWNIWIGTYVGDKWRQRYRHLGHVVISKNALNALSATLPHYNTQFSTFVIGSLLIHAASTTVRNLIPVFKASVDRRLEQIWPLNKQFVTFPTATVLSDDDADYIANALSYRLLSKA